MNPEGAMKGDEEACVIDRRAKRLLCVREAKPTDKRYIINDER